MTFVIDTSAARWFVAVIDDSGRGQTIVESTDRPDLAAVFRTVEKPARIAVASGPGSFTGLRVGVSFGLGVAMGLGIPIVPLPSLDLQAARSRIPATAVLEAGRGRVYSQPPSGRPALADPADIPATHPLVGNVTPKTEAALIAARHHFVPSPQLRDFASAAAIVLETASEVAYGSLEITYMQSFSKGA